MRVRVCVCVSLVCVCVCVCVCVWCVCGLCGVVVLMVLVKGFIHSEKSIQNA